MWWKKSTYRSKKLSKAQEGNIKKKRYSRHIIGEGNGTLLQHSYLENPMNRGAWWAAVHGVTKSRTRLSDFTFTFDFHALEKEMATHSSVLAWRIPGTGEPGGLPSIGSHRVGHDWSDLAAAADTWFLAAVWDNTDIYGQTHRHSFVTSSILTEHMLGVEYCTRW